MLIQYGGDHRFLMHALRSRIGKILLLSGYSVLLPIALHASDRPTWAKHATPLDLGCSRPGQRIESPDRQWTITVGCRTGENADPAYSLRVYERGGRTFDLPLEERTQELLWAPDSKAFFVNGSHAGYWGFFVTVYQVTPDGPRKRIITDLAQRDMVASFPPCEAAHRDETVCARLSKSPEYNMSGVGWASDSRSVFVFAEVPCSSSYGGIMCQVLGYELGVSDGRILKRLTAPQIQTQWRDLMGWDMQMPEAPIYGGPQSPP